MRYRLVIRMAGPVVVLLALAPFAVADGTEPGPLLARIKAVGKVGSGNVEASKAWRELVKLGPDVLPAILESMDDADATAANWLRNAVDAIAERELTAGRPLPAAKLEAFVLQTRHQGRVRRLAYEWLAKADPSASDRLLPGMLHDATSAELRRDAVARIIQEAEAPLRKGDRPAAKAAYLEALSGARDRDQVELIAKQLKAFNVDVDLAAHFGFIRRWMLVAPFDNTTGTDFRKVYPPEEKADLGATYKGKKGAAASWVAHTTKDPYGVVDLNKALGNLKGTTAYAFAAVVSPAERPVEVRLGCINAVKVFLNGKQIIAHEEYHHGMRMDQYVGFGKLKAGRNEVLVKVYQNEQSEDWAQSWQFQLRLCDTVGGAVPFTLAAEKPANQPQEGKVRP